MINIHDKLTRALESTARTHGGQMVQIVEGNYVVHPDSDDAFLDPWATLAMLHLQFSSEYLEYSITGGKGTVSDTIWYYGDKPNKFQDLLVAWGKAIRDGKAVGGLK